MSDYLDEIHDATNTICDIGHSLEFLGSSFYSTGNEVMGKRLCKLSEELHKNQDKINKAVGREINREFQQAQQSAANTIKACLAMSENQRNSDS